MKQQTRITLLACLLASTSPSCVHHKVVETEPASKIQFASNQAAVNFYEGYLNLTKKELNSVSIGIGLPYQFTKVPSKRKQVNAALKQADSNRNNIISISEAKSYRKSRISRSSESGNEQQNAPAS